MPTQPQRLLELSETLLELEPWNFVDERGLFLVSLPGRETPYTVTVFGDSVDVMGIELALEPEAFRRLVKLHDPETTEAEIESFRPGRALSVVFMGAGQIPSEFKKVWKAGGYRSRGGRPSPQFAANDGNEIIRPIKRSEGSLLGLALHAVIEGLKNELLSPPDVASGIEAALLLTVESDDPDALEDATLPAVRQSIVPWPDPRGSMPAPHVPSDSTRKLLSELPQREGPLALAGSISEGSEDPAVPTGAYAMLLFDPVEGLHLATSVLGEGDESESTGKPLSPPAEALEIAMTELFSAVGERPETLYVEDASLALMTFPACHAIGTAPVFAPFIGGFADAVDDAIKAHGGRSVTRLSATIDALEAIGGDEIPDEFPASLRTAQDWHDAFRHGSAMLLIEGQRTGAIPAAAELYFGSQKNRGRATTLMSAVGGEQAFYLYAVEDHRSSPDAATVLEALIESAESSQDVGELETEALRARGGVEVSLYRVDDERMEAVDLLSDARYSIDIDLDGVCRFDGHTMLLRRYKLGDFTAFALAGMPLEEDGEAEHRKRLEKSLGGALSHERLRTHGHAAGGMWLEVAAQISAAIQAKEES